MGRFGRLQSPPAVTSVGWPGEAGQRSWWPWPRQTFSRTVIVARCPAMCHTSPVLACTGVERLCPDYWWSLVVTVSNLLGLSRRPSYLTSPAVSTSSLSGQNASNVTKESLATALMTTQRCILYERLDIQHGIGVSWGARDFVLA